MKKRMKQGAVGFLVLIAVLLLAVAVVFLARGGQPAAEMTAPPVPSPTASLQPEPIPEGTPSPEVSPSATPDEVDGLPVGKWVITPERKSYVEDSLTLYIPALNVTRAVHDGTTAAALSRGVGLYEYAQLPGEGNRNVSIAGHRNGLDQNGNITDHAPFYYVDQLQNGDYLYLYDSRYIYRYVYEKTWVVEADDWSPIATTGDSCLTITSCTPIGVSDHRIVVRGLLDKIIDYSSDYDFLSHVPEKEETS